MTFISYAQNFEDVMLWRALKHIESGFYIDIGAQDPVVDSVSLAFYEHGWRGVHVEPTEQYSLKLKKARPDEVVVQVAIGNSDGAITFYEFKDTGLSTADVDVAIRHKNAGFDCVETIVPVITLDKLFERTGVDTVHWMKLDVEGLEKNVLESWGHSPIRPWILVIESTRPTTQEESHSEWETLVLAKDYGFAYFDGLNRYYVSKEKWELAKAFLVAPNIFDGFMLSGLASQPFGRLIDAKARHSEARAQQLEAGSQQLEARIQQAEAETRQAETKVQQAEAKVQQAAAQAQQALQTIEAVYASTSWKVTMPLRWLGAQARHLKREGLAARTEALMKKLARSLLRGSTRYIDSRPGLRMRIVGLAHRFGIYQKLRVFYSRLSANKQSQLPDICTVVQSIQSDEDAFSHLTPRARQIYDQLKTMVEKKNKGGN